jgi:hypothetical protein
MRTSFGKAPVLPFNGASTTTCGRVPLTASAAQSVHVAANRQASSVEGRTAGLVLDCFGHVVFLDLF